MNITAQYTDETLTSVFVSGDFTMTIDRSSTDWLAYGIDVQEEQGDILPWDYVEEATEEVAEPVEEVVAERTWQAIFTTASNYSVKVVGSINYGMIAPYHPLWKKLGIDELIANGEVKAHDWDSPADISPTAEDIAAKNEALAKSHRDALINARDINVYGVNWQVGEFDREKITTAIDTAKRNGINERNWTLSDNTLRLTTVSELEGVMDAWAFRMDSIQTQYEQWRQGGDLLTPFVYEPDY